MSQTHVTLSVVVPAYEEAANLEVLLPRLKKSLERLGVSHELFIIDTVEPRDDTAEICAKNGVRCMRRSPSNTFGDAYRTAIRETRGRCVLFMDADGSHPPEFIQQLQQHANDYDIVIASRYVQGGGTEVSPILQFMSRIVNLSYALVLGIRCQDMSNSFKIYDGDRLRALDLRCKNYDILEEMIVGFARDGKALRIKEVPFMFKRREKGKTKRKLLLFIFSYFFTLMRLRFRSWPNPHLTEKAAGKGTLDNSLELQHRKSA